MTAGRGGVYALILATATLSAACGEQSEEARPGAGPPSAVSAPGTNAPASPSRAVSRQEAFLARIKQAARGNNAIIEARMNGDDELGVVLGAQVKLDQVRDLMTTLLREMRDEFPNRPLTVLAYAPNGQPMATMRYDPSAPSNANVTYQPNF